MKKKIAVSICLASFLSVLFVGVCLARTFMIEDFDSGTTVNLLGGRFDAWDKDPEDDTQGCWIEFDADMKNGNEGYSLKISYDVDSPRAAYNGIWMKLENFDASMYDYLVFYARGSKDRKEKFPKRFKIELKNDGEKGEFFVLGLQKNRWNQVKIPLKKIRGLTHYDGLTEFVIVFEDMQLQNKEGVLYIDDLQFETSKKTKR